MGSEVVRQGAVSRLMVAEDTPKVPSELLLAFAPLHRGAMGVAVGVVLGNLVFLATVVEIVRGGRAVSNLWLLAQFFFGYRVTVPGAFIGLLWGFGVGFILGWSFALLRNMIVWIWLTVIRSRAEMEQYGDFLDHL